MARAVLRARNVGLRTLFMHCLAENDAIMHLAGKLGMDIVTQAPEAERAPKPAARGRLEPFRRSARAARGALRPRPEGAIAAFRRRA